MRALSIALGLAIGSSCASPTPAADLAERAVLGFSGDGRHFAFEQYGIHDGSGFPYAEIVVLDTTTNRPAPGTPIQVEVESDTDPVAVARDLARASAGDLLARLDIAPRGRQLVAQPLSETSADPHRVTFTTEPPPPLRPVERELVLTLIEEAVAIDACAFAGMPIKALIVELSGRAGEQLTPIATARRDPPADRCPLGHAISDVLIYDPPTGPAVLVLLTHQLNHGYEGPDRRFDALALPLPSR